MAPKDEIPSFPTACEEVNGAQSCFMCCLGTLSPSFLFSPCLIRKNTAFNFYFLSNPTTPILTPNAIIRIPEPGSSPSETWQKPPQFPLATSVFHSNLSIRCYQNKFLKLWLSQSPLMPSWVLLHSWSKLLSPASKSAALQMSCIYPLLPMVTPLRDICSTPISAG